VDAVVDCTDQTTRAINQALKRLAAEGAKEIRVLYRTIVEGEPTVPVAA